MNKYERMYASEGPTAEFDQGLRQLMLTMYNHTASGLAVSGAVGMSSEAGEFAEIIKKCVFQGKEMTDDIKKHLASELGDVAWYWINSCRALGVDPNEVIGNNVEKLKARYPGGEFNAFSSENRAEGDI